MGQSSWRSLSMISVTCLVLLLGLSTSSARQCTGPQFRPNMSLVPGDSVELDCHLPACPPPSRITWLRSDSPEDVRYPLVSTHPVIFTLHNAMPEETGWYICETDYYQSYVYVNIVINTPPHPPFPTPPPTPKFRKMVSSTTPARPTPVPEVGRNVQFKVQTPPLSSQFSENPGTADQLKVYGTY